MIEENTTEELLLAGRNNRLDDGAVDSLDTHCRDHLYACCSDYFCQRLINNKPTS